MTRAPGRHALTFIFVTVLVDMIGIGIIVPVLPSLMLDVLGETDVAKAAQWGGALVFVFALGQFVFGPVIGNLSDAYGRRPVLLASLTGYSIDFFFMAMAPSMIWLFVGRLFSGIFGATYSTAMAYIADITPKEERAGKFALIGAAFGVGFLVGPVVGGLIGEAFGPRAPFVAAGILAGLNALYGFFVLPETLARDKRRSFDLKRANPVGALRQMQVFPAVMGLAAVMFLYHLAHWVFTSTWAYYAIARFDWSEAQIGYSLGAVALVSGLVQAGLTGRAVKWLGEWRTANIALGFMALQCVMLAFATAPWMVYAAIVMGAPGAMAMPALNGMTSRAVPETQQGELQGALSSLQSITALIGPLMMTQLFAAFTRDDAAIVFPGVSFLAASLLLAGALVTLLTSVRARPS